MKTCVHLKNICNYMIMFKRFEKNLGRTPSKKTKKKRNIFVKQWIVQLPSCLPDP